MLLPNRVDFGLLFLFHKFSNFTPPLQDPKVEEPAEQSESELSEGSGLGSEFGSEDFGSDFDELDSEAEEPLKAEREGKNADDDESEGGFAEGSGSDRGGVEWME